MDVKKEDGSEMSRDNHVAYYKSLTKMIVNLQNEKMQSGTLEVRDHLDKRIDAIEKDKMRIREMFPDVSKEEWGEENAHIS